MVSKLIELTILKSVCSQLPDQAARQKFWEESLTLSIQSLEASVNRFKDAIQSRNSAELGQAAHKIVGTISFVGVKALSERLLMLQDECDENQISWPFAEEEYFLQQFALISKALNEAKNNPP